MSVEGRSIGVPYPPEVQPVGINLVLSVVVSEKSSSQRAYLVIRNQNNSLGKVKFDETIVRRPNLPSNTLVAADPHRRRSPDIRHEASYQGKVPLRHGHVGIVPFPVDKVQRQSNHLRYERPIQVSTKSLFSQV